MLLVSGCSFVNNSWFPRAMFGDEVYNKKKCTLLAEGGAGNQYISASIIESLNCDTEYVFVLFSGLGRIDVPVPVAMETEIEEYWHKTKLNNKFWFHSGGFGGSWNWKGAETEYAKWLRGYLEAQYKPMDYDYLADLSFTSITACLGLLEQKNIPYRWGFIYDIHTDYSSTMSSLSAAISDTHPRLLDLPVESKLDSTPHEWCKERNLLDQTDQFHPSADGYKKWADSIRPLVDFELTPGR